jgi:N-methylhydantoinase B/oxoprolinase/acetone carboxylase alpha subunit
MGNRQRDIPHCGTPKSDCAQMHVNLTGAEGKAKFGDVVLMNAPAIAQSHWPSVLEISVASQGLAHC